MSYPPPGNEFLHQPGIMLGTLELLLDFDPAPTDERGHRSE